MTWITARKCILNDGINSSQPLYSRTRKIKPAKRAKHAEVGGGSGGLLVFRWRPFLSRFYPRIQIKGEKKEGCEQSTAERRPVMLVCLGRP